MGNAFRPLFDGHTLTGWHAMPRLPVPRMPGGPEPKLTPQQRQQALAHTGHWTVEDGAIVGRQNPPGCGLGAYLLSDALFGDFELELEANPDWPADTGILVRTADVGSLGYQILVDHRKSGNIGGFYGNGIGGFHAIRYTLDVRNDAAGNPAGLVLEDATTTLEPMTPDKPALLSQGATGEEFLKVWKWQEWNTFRIRVEGHSPRITVHINGTLISQINTASMEWPGYDPAVIRKVLGQKGHIAFEVHDNDPGMGEARWGKSAACRWRNIRIREI